MGFQGFGKIARLSRDMVITEKIDGTNAQVCIVHSLAPEAGAIAHKSLGDAGDLSMFAGSRTRWITPADDNQGFAKWAQANAEELFTLGPGAHFGEWWGQGIQRKYGLMEKRFSLFNVTRWANILPEGQTPRPTCCLVVPTLYRGEFDTEAINNVLRFLTSEGSMAAPGFMRPEGVVIYHEQSRTLFKKTLEKDSEPKSRQV